MTESTKSFVNCPKCQAEVNHLSIGGIVYEECPNCLGIFLDFSETDCTRLAEVSVPTGKARKDTKQIDHLEISCPKCNVKMEKKPAKQQSDLILDVCPSCRGTWFDHGEFSKYSGFVTRVATKAPFKLWLECKKCGVKRDKDEVKPGKEGASCPRCGGLLTLKSVKLLEKADLRKDAKAIAIYLVPVVIIFILCNAVLGPGVGANFVAFISCVFAIALMKITIHLENKNRA